MLRPNYDVWLDMFSRTMDEGYTIAPRGYKIKEIRDLQFTIDSLYPFMNFMHRKLNIPYFKKEMIWKLGGDPFDDSIKLHAKMWDQVQNTDGSFNSNYGQYWFGQQQGLMKVFNELVLDKDSRRAVIPMLSDKHIGPHVKDTVCTECVGFHIRGDVLHMSVHMRSSDQIFGLGTDLPTFAFLQRLLLGMLKYVYQNLRLGTMTVTAMSSHIYDRHFVMVDNILNDTRIAECSVMPIIVHPDEAFKIVASRGRVDPSWGPLAFWLTQEIA